MYLKLSFFFRIGRYFYNFLFFAFRKIKKGLSSSVFFSFNLLSTNLNALEVFTFTGFFVMVKFCNLITIQVEVEKIKYYYLKEVYISPKSIEGIILTFRGITLWNIFSVLPLLCRFTTHFKFVSAYCIVWLHEFQRKF